MLNLLGIRLHPAVVCVLGAALIVGGLLVKRPLLSLAGAAIIVVVTTPPRRSARRLEPPAGGPVAMSAAAIDAHHLTKRFGPVVAVHDLDLRVAPGETVAVLGPNGAGKTTALDVIAGFAAPTAGTVRVLGQDPRAADRRWRARVSTVVQHTSLDDHVKVREVLEVFASLYANPVPIADVLDSFDLGAHGGRRIGTLSGGQRRRVDLALSVIGRPEVVFLDEPTTGLDPHARRRTWRLIGDIATAGAAVVLTTHHIDEAAELADRVVVLVGGRKVVDEPPAALRRRCGPATVRLHVADVDERTELVALLPGAAELTTGEVRCTTGDVTAILGACFIVGRTLATVMTAVLNAGAAMVAAIALAGADVSPAGAVVTLVVLTTGALTWALLGTAASGLIDRAEGAWPTLALSDLPLMAVSGAFGPPVGPAWLTTIASGLPAAPFVHAVDAALGGATLPTARDVAVLTAWGAVALAVSLRTFRWLPHQRR